MVAMGVLKWVDWTVSEPRYFQLQTDHTPIHLALLDEVWRGVAASFSFINDGGHLSTSTLPPRRSARATSCCTRRSSSCSSSCLRRSTASWTSWSRFAFCPPVLRQSVHWKKTQLPPTPLSSRCVGFTCPCQLELKKTLLDRMVHLLSRGYVLPVVGYIRKCLEKLNTDISLIRYFVTEVRSAPDVRR